MTSVNDVLNARRGHVVAPAGCGKTELISKALAVATDKPSLVLTHTTAGVAALRNRLTRAGISSQNYRLNTIDGWALNLISMFPERAGYRHDPMYAPKYAQVQFAIGNLCQAGHINREIKATYSRLLVDEYQDCSVSQHLIVTGMSNAIPTVVFGDPMQAIFGFGGNFPPDWNTQVATFFPQLGQLVTPWRWNNKEANDLGAWLLSARTALYQGHQINLTTCPNRVFWYQLTGDDNANLASQVNVQYQIARQYPNDSILVIGDSRSAASRHNYASRVKGLGVVEPVEFSDMIGFASRMHGRTGPILLQECINFLSAVMTNVQGAQMLSRIQTIIAGRNRTEPTMAELEAIKLYQDGGMKEAANFLQAMSDDGSTRVYRLSAFNIMISAIKMTAAGQDRDLNVEIAKLREQYRHTGRMIPEKALGSTLLLKGLESDHVLILDADRPGSVMSKEHLYVALTRGAKSVHVFSRNYILP